MNAIKCAMTALLAATAGIATISSAFANSIYMKLPGVTGPVTNSNFPGDIALRAYSQGFTDPYSGGATGSGSTAGKVTCGAISIVKLVDSTSPDFLRYVTTGQAIPSATIYFVGGGAAGAVPYTVTLTDVHVTSIEQGDTVGNTSGLGITENISMVADKFLFSYRPVNNDGSLGAAETYTWNCGTNSAS